MNNKIFVVKRSGETEEFNVKKIKKVVDWAIKDLNDVHTDQIIKYFDFNYTSDGISTEQIHNSLIDTCLDLISVDTPDYQYVAGRLLNYSIRKKVWGGANPPRLIDLIKQNTKLGYYSPSILEKYSVKDINKINEFIKHDRDFDFTHGGIKQMVDKYLVQNRSTKEIFESPQFVYALVSMTLFQGEKKDRLEWVKRAYDGFSTFKINLATPVLAGARTPLKSYASCALFAVDDTLDSICAHDYLFKKASAARYGLGFDISRLRPLNAKIRNGDVLHTGLVPYLKNFEAGIKSCHQNGLRGASGTVFINWWHMQVEDVLVLKNNALPDELSVRHLDFCLVFSKLLRERIKTNQKVSLFNPHECPELIERFGYHDWDDLYLKRENDDSVSRKVISARSLGALFAKERLGTGRVYAMDIDNVNDQSPYNEQVTQSNLCVEVLQPTHPSHKWNDENGMIGVCILSGINALNVSDDEFESICEVTVRMLDNLIDYQDYFDTAAGRFAKKYRSLGIGTLNFAAYLADKHVKYDDIDAPNVAAEFAEKLSYYTIKASIGLAKERGAFEYLDKTKWKEGSLPIDRYSRTVDEFVTTPLALDWEALRKDLIKFGIRHSTLTAYMPVESSSVVSGSTSGVEPIRDYIISKTSKAGKVISVAPRLKKNKHFYSLAFDLTSNDYLGKVYAAINKFTCMSISANTYINVSHFENKQVPLSTIIKDTLNFFDWGGKTQYYNNTEDGSGESEMNESGCAGGACSL